MELSTIKTRLSSLGFESDADEMLEYIAQSEEADILRKCNCEAIPEGFMGEAVDMVCARYLMIQKSSGADLGIDFDAAVSSISEGDVSVSFAVGRGAKTAEQRFEELVAYLMRGAQNVTDYRRVRW